MHKIHLAVIGERFELSRLRPAPGQALTLESSAPGSLTAIDSGRLTPDRIGFYRIRVGDEGSPGWRRVDVFAVPRSVDAHPALRGGPYSASPRAIVESLINGEQCDFESVTESRPYPLVLRPRPGGANGDFESVEPRLQNHGLSHQP